MDNQPPRVPTVPWARFYEEFSRAFRQGDHVTLVGPTRSGKTYLALRVIELRGYVLFLATKPRDPLIAALQADGYRIQRKLEIRRDPDTGRPVDRRIVFWPVTGHERGKGKSLASDQERQAAEIRRALDYAYRAGNWTVFADETIWLADDLGLKRELTALEYQGRTLGISMVCAAQRLAWVPRACLSQPDHIFLFATADREDLKRVSDLAGANVDRVRATLPTLDYARHEFLYVGTRSGVLLRSRAD